MASQPRWSASTSPPSRTRLGAKLLNRTTRNQSLPSVGRAHYERCGAILADTETTGPLGHALGTTTRGCLRVSGPVTFGACSLAPTPMRFLERHPEVDVDLSM